MDVRELGPGDRDHLARRVELHGARAQRDHRAVERQVLVGEAAQVAQHLGLGVVAVEHRVREERRACARGAAGTRFELVRDRGRRRANASPMPPREDAARCASTSARVVVSSSEMPSACASTRAEVDARGAARARRSPAVRAPVATVSVSKKRASSIAKPSLLEPGLQDRRQAVHAPRDALEACGPVIDGVHRAITASSTCAVQMFEVAFSRRMCCSRVCSARR